MSGKSGLHGQLAIDINGTPVICALIGVLNLVSEKRTSGLKLYIASTSALTDILKKEYSVIPVQSKKSFALLISLISILATGIGDWYTRKCSRIIKSATLPPITNATSFPLERSSLAIPIHFIAEPIDPEFGGLGKNITRLIQNHSPLK